MAYGAGYDMDLSLAARDIDLTGPGTTPVRVTAL
jgi:hypothetical protein